MGLVSARPVLHKSSFQADECISERERELSDYRQETFQINSMNSPSMSGQNALH